MVGRVDVARRAGVSPAVVSYVLNGSHPVSDETRLRVEAAILELDYRPNALARSLATSRSHTLGLLIPDSSNPYFAELASAVEDAALASNLVVLLGNGADDAGRELGYLRAFRDRQVDGVIAVFGAGFEEGWREISKRRMPAVSLDRLPPGLDVPSVVVDNIGGARVATEHLVEHGRRRIACITGGAELSSARDRARGWSEALADAGLVGGGVAAGTRVGEAQPVSPLLSYGAFTVDSGYTAATELLRRDPSVDAIFVASDMQAMGVLRAVADVGRTPGADLAIVGFDGTKLSEYTTPRLTTITQPYAQLATEAVGMLGRIIADPASDRAAMHLVLPTELTRRDTCGCGPP
ncbi:LacI family DNA-binding transcriptional regulator [Leucobacter salsicius]|uniref:LacI family DNA-binding transcriptional regulator n=1 Tax=Leucobacter salsicius TaxID=664638 RepID=UPI000349EBB1|nr:LacI family DNA-binding transcriptional regulator [Leucobacter salsicius]